LKETNRQVRSETVGDKGIISLCINGLKNKPPTIKSRWKAYALVEVGISSITVAELFCRANQSALAEKKQTGTIKIFITANY
jgi:predicted nucleic acid-binding protein